jgi:hypothetical protein
VAAIPTSGRFWRRARNESDWENQIQKGRLLGADECERAALSCFTDEKALRQTLKIKEAWAGNGVVVADLQPEHGVCQHNTRTKHVNVWLSRAAFNARATLFRGTRK